MNNKKIEFSLAGMRCDTTWLQKKHLYIVSICVLKVLHDGILKRLYRHKIHGILYMILLSNKHSI